MGLRVMSLINRQVDRSMSISLTENYTTPTIEVCITNINDRYGVPVVLIRCWLKQLTCGILRQDWAKIISIGKNLGTAKIDDERSSVNN